MQLLLGDRADRYQLSHSCKAWEHHCLRRYLEKTGLLGCFLLPTCALKSSEVHGPLPGPTVSSWALPWTHQSASPPVAYHPEWWTTFLSSSYQTLRTHQPFLLGLIFSCLLCVTARLTYMGCPSELSTVWSPAQGQPKGNKSWTANADKGNAIWSCT